MLRTPRAHSAVSPHQNGAGRPVGMLVRTGEDEIQGAADHDEREDEKEERSTTDLLPHTWGPPSLGASLKSATPWQRPQVRPTRPAMELARF